MPANNNNNTDDTPVFDDFGEWIGGREPTRAEQIAAWDRADAIVVAEWEKVDGGARREDEWAEWDALSDAERLHFASF